MFLIIILIHLSSCFFLLILGLFSLVIINISSVSRLYYPSFQLSVVTSQPHASRYKKYSGSGNPRYFSAWISNRLKGKIKTFSNTVIERWELSLFKDDTLGALHNYCVIKLTTSLRKRCSFHFKISPIRPLSRSCWNKSRNVVMIALK